MSFPAAVVIESCPIPIGISYVRFFLMSVPHNLCKFFTLLRSLSDTENCVSHNNNFRGGCCELPAIEEMADHVPAWVVVDNIDWGHGDGHLRFSFLFTGGFICLVFDDWQRTKPTKNANTRLRRSGDFSALYRYLDIATISTAGRGVAFTPFLL